MKILLTGANGYVGSRLREALVEAGHEVVALVRSRHRISDERVEVIEGDLLKPSTLKQIPNDIDIAYYLVHSMSQSRNKFINLERQSALNFVNAMGKTDLKQVIYLSGLVNDKNLSPHLQSRLQVENILQKLPHTILRAGIIIGSGSASFEIIRDLVEKLPLMIAPKWVKNRCQPIGIVDVIRDLIGVQGLFINQVLDIGGPDILTYKELLLGLARERGLRRFILNVPFFTPKLSSYWLYFVTSTNFTLATSLVDSLKNEAICCPEKMLVRKRMDFYEMVDRAFMKIEQNAVVSSWRDTLAWGELPPKLTRYMKIPEFGCLSETVCQPFKGDPEEVVERVWCIGGKNGWYSMDWAWRLRGFIDQLFGGVGLRRGRTNREVPRCGDAIDFWRVIVADKSERRLLLYAEMKLPGEAWLEFHVKNSVLNQTATFRPKGVLGRIYWYSLWPFHKVIFKQMAQKITNV